MLLLSPNLKKGQTRPLDETKLVNLNRVCNHTEVKKLQTVRSRHSLDIFLKMKYFKYNSFK